jgi:3-hydroxybutyryl-CoA dehydrogenase
MAIRNVGIVGCGTMGAGIAQVCAQKGYSTTVREVNDDFLRKGREKLTGFLAEGVKKGKVAQADMDKALANLKWTTSAADLKDCDLVIEAVIEKLDEKQKVFAELDKVCKPEAIFGSNTSSISITAIASVTKRRDKFIGLHFMNPVPIMKLVEIVRAEITAASTYDECRAFIESLGKTVVTAKDSPGFIINLLLIPYVTEAIRALDSGLATKEDIDAGMKLGCNFPMGPIELADFIGLDVCLDIANVLHREFGDPRYAAPPLLKRMVTAGFLGRKSGRGFYDYTKK